jgi:hypothetical protein
VNPVSALVSFLIGLFGREVWEWLPALTRSLLRIITRPLPSERRELRRKEWEAELSAFEQRRIAALIWVLGLLPVCAWESVVTRDVVGRVTAWLEVVASVLLMYFMMGSAPMAIAAAICHEQGLPPLETVAIVAVSPIGAYGALALTVYPGMAVVMALILVCHWLSLLWRLFFPGKQVISPARAGNSKAATHPNVTEAKAMAKDHGPSVKNDKQYEGLRKKGMSKERAAKIANSSGSSKRGGKSSS